MDKSLLEFLFAGPLFSIFKTLNEIRKDLSTLATQADVDALASRVSAVGQRQVKAVGEVKKAVDALKDQIANLPAPQPDLDLSGLDQAVSSAESGAAELDDLNPDEVTPDPTPEPTPVDTGDTGVPPEQV